MCVSPCGARLFLGGGAGAGAAPPAEHADIRLWGVAEGAELRRFRGHAGAVLSACASPRGRHLFSGSADATARMWDVASGRAVRGFRGHSGGVVCVCAGAPAGGDGAAVLFTAAGDGAVCAWDPGTGAALRRIEAWAPLRDGRGGAAPLLSVSACGAGLFSGPPGADGVRMWSAQTGEADAGFRARRVGASAAFSSLCGKYLFAPSCTAVKVYSESRQGGVLRALAAHGDGVLSVYASPCERYLLIGTDTGAAQVQCVASGVTRTFTHAAGVGVCAVCWMHPSADT